MISVPPYLEPLRELLQSEGIDPDQLNSILRSWLLLPLHQYAVNFFEDEVINDLEVFYIRESVENIIELITYERQYPESQISREDAEKLSASEESTAI